MHVTLPANIQKGQKLEGKNPLASLGKVATLPKGKNPEAKLDFLSVLSSLENKNEKTLPQANDKLQKIISNLSDGKMIAEELSPEEALEIKNLEVLTSKKSAPLFSEKKNLFEEKEVSKEMKKPEFNIQVISHEESAPLAMKKDEISTLLSGIQKKASPGAMQDINFKNELPLAVKEELPLTQADLFVLKNNVAQAKPQASREYVKGQNPFETNIIQFKKENISKKENEIETSTMKPLELLARESNSIPSKENAPQMQMSLGQNVGHVKALDLSSVTNSQEVINKVVNYLEQNNAQNKPNLDIQVSHESLGKIQIHAEKTHVGDGIKLQITTQSPEAHDFFIKNEGQLSKALADSGIKVSDLKFSQFSSEVFSSKNFDSSSQNHSGQESYQGSRYYSQEKHDSREGDSRRRQELWNEYKERSMA